jgi:tetratricopeptide (TPR) repeat protein
MPRPAESMETHVPAAGPRSGPGRAGLVCFALGLAGVHAVAYGQAEPSSTPREMTSNIETARIQLARDVVTRAEELFAVGDYSAALAEFTRADHLLEGDPRRTAVLHNIAICYQHMFRYDQALQAYGRLLDSSQIDDGERREIENEVRMLRGLLGTLRISSNVAAEVWVDDHPLGRVPGRLMLPAGEHLIEVHAASHQDKRREVRVTAGSSQHLHFELDTLPMYRGLPRIYFWTGAAVTLTGLAAGTAIGIAALRADHEGRQETRAGLRPSGQDAHRLAAAADVAFGASALFAVGSGVLLFLTDWSSDEHALGAARRLQ